MISSYFTYGKVKDVKMSNTIQTWGNAKIAGFKLFSLSVKEKSQNTTTLYSQFRLFGLLPLERKKPIYRVTELGKGDKYMRFYDETGTLKKAGRVDVHGKRQGRWLEKEGYDKAVRIYKDDKEQSLKVFTLTPEKKWTLSVQSFTKDGVFEQMCYNHLSHSAIKTVMSLNDAYYIVEYYENSKLKKSETTMKNNAYVETHYNQGKLTDLFVYRDKKSIDMLFHRRKDGKEVIDDVKTSLGTWIRKKVDENGKISAAYILDFKEPVIKGTLSEVYKSFVEHLRLKKTFDGERQDKISQLRKLPTLSARKYFLQGYRCGQQERSR